jgi:predicted lipoprotein with Yx(FWY)xxD motif
LTFVPACVADETGIADDPSAGMSSGGEAPKAGSGNSTAGTSSDAGGAPGAGTGSGQAGSAVTPVGGGAGGSDEIGEGGAPILVGEGGQMNGQAGQGDGGAGTPPVAMSCLFHTDAPADPGAGGAPPATVVLQTSAFLGSYLTDAAGRTLYTYGADLPGDCETPPTSGCVADCLVSWPIFEAGSRVLGAGLNDAAFGEIDRGDGVWQTTYYGWPLYYYKSDLLLGQLTGQGKGKTWHVAELTPPSVQIMKGVPGTKYLADATGRTLYVSAADQAGTDQADPVSACEGDCLATFKPFRERHLSVVTSLDESQFTVFARAGAGALQLAYKGLPLYTAKTDTKSGDATGVSSPGFTAAVP